MDDHHDHADIDTVAGLYHCVRDLRDERDRLRAVVEAVRVCERAWKATPLDDEFDGREHEAMRAWAAVVQALTEVDRREET